MTIYKPIIVVGMARSGTTLVSHLLGSLRNVHLELEPHVMWKAGNFQYLSDAEFDIRDDAVQWVRANMLSAAGNKVLVEKSPVNCIRPRLVHAVFPEAKIVYVERDMVSCIASNLNRSLEKDSFRLSIILRKYLRYTGSPDLAGAISKRKLHQQLRLRDYPAFYLYALRMMWLRNVRNEVPFGPKLKDFSTVVATEGLVAYHVHVAVAALHCARIYQELYGDRFKSFRLEQLQRDRHEIRRLYEYCGFEVDDTFIDHMISTYSPRAIAKVMSRGRYHDEIESRLLAEGIR